MLSARLVPKGSVPALDTLHTDDACGGDILFAMSEVLGALPARDAGAGVTSRPRAVLSCIQEKSIKHMLPRAAYQCWCKGVPTPLLAALTHQLQRW